MIQVSQQELYRLESHCIQEEPPYCQAACPFHVDGRELCSLVAKGKWAEARAHLDRIMPLSEIMARLCEAPCREKCRRAEYGGALALEKLERVVMLAAPPSKKRLLLPPAKGNVLVIGAGFSSLVAAADLARRGRKVTIRHTGESIGGKLLKIQEEILPKKILEEEIASIQALGVIFESNLAGSELGAGTDGFDAVYIGLDDPFTKVDLGLDKDENGLVIVDPISLQTSKEKIFAGGQGEGTVWNAADGRRGALSIQRFLQEASLTTSRENEGPHETRLQSFHKGTPDIPEIPSASPFGYTQEEARLEAERCLSCQCLECVKLCRYLQHYKTYPKKAVREIYNNLSIVQGMRQTNTFINSCSLCAQCDVICPTGFKMSELCKDSREIMISQDKMPPSAHEFAILDMAYNTGERSALLRNEPGKKKSAYAFFPGCQLSGSDPGLTERVYTYLRSNLKGGVGLMLFCCGAPAKWAAQDEFADSVIQRIRKFWEDSGKPTLITACPSCSKTLKDLAPDINTAHIWEILGEIGAPADMKTAPAPKETMTLIDPCSAKYFPGLGDKVREVMGKAGLTLEEAKDNGDLAACCGYGGLQASANPIVGKEVAEARGGGTTNDLLAYCIMCRDSVIQVGKRCAHALDFLFPPEEMDKFDPAGRPRPLLSARQDNRALLKNFLLASVWNEPPKDLFMNPYDTIELIASDDVRNLLDKRRILDEDIRRVIHMAEESGQKMIVPDNGHFMASLKPINVTFWVEYTPVEGKEETFEIFNAYSHRMHVQGAGDPGCGHDCHSHDHDHDEHKH